MWQAFLKIVANGGIRVATLTLFCLGFTFASTYPYQSIIGIQQLRMGEGQYAILMVATALAGMLTALVLGYFSDRAKDRKQSILVALAVGAAGFGLFSALPSIFTFVFCLVVVMPVSSSAYGQLFAVIRAITQRYGSTEAASVNSIVRSIYAASWIVVPGLVGLFIATRSNVSDSFAIAAAAFALCFVVYGLFGASTPNTQVPQNGAWAGLQEALWLVASRNVFLRIAALALIASPHPSNAALLPLFITHLPGGTTTEVGLIAGLVAGLEIPFMLLGGHFSRSYPTWVIIVAAGLCHALYLLGLGFASTTWHIYALSLLNAAGAAILLSLHLNYVQDLMPNRPGLGTSLMSIVALLTKATGALVFAAAGTAFGFSGAAWLGAAVAVAGCLLLFSIEKTWGR
jgi:predicted MFS family arabinose efflux permease